LLRETARSRRVKVGGDAGRGAYERRQLLLRRLLVMLLLSCYCVARVGLVVERCLYTACEQ
jgi:hypothetical protein